MVEHVYLGSTPSKDTPPMTVTQILAMAAHFRFGHLMTWCEAVLLQKLTIENACDMLTLANRHGLNAIYQLSSELIQYNINQVMATESWARLTSGQEDTPMNLTYHIKVI
jgi:hypothetical protein